MPSTKLFKKGDWVKDTNYGYVGRITKSQSKVSTSWYEGQAKKPSKGRDQTWYSVLVASGGSVLVAEQNLKPWKPVKRPSAHFKYYAKNYFKD